MKKILLVLCISMLLLNNSANADINKEAGFISLSTSQEKEMEPNFASVTFAVENTASEAQKASAENNEISNKIIKALKSISSSQTDMIKTSNFSIRPVYATSASGKRVIKNYTAVNSIRVETKDVKKVAKFIDSAISNGANRTDNLVYSLKNEREICRELYPQMVKELTSMARELALASGTSVEGLKHMNVSCNSDSVSNGRFFTKAMALGAAADEVQAAPAPVEAGKIKIRVFVNADYYVK